MNDWRAELETRTREATCRLVTRGRRTGRSHTVTIWFAVDDAGRIYVATLRMERDWPRNVLADPAVTFAIGDWSIGATARLLEDEKARAEGVRVIAQKYWGAWLAGWLGLGPEGVFEVVPGGDGV